MLILSATSREDIQLHDPQFKRNKARARLGLQPTLKAPQRAAS